MSEFSSTEIQAFIYSFLTTNLLSALFCLFSITIYFQAKPLRIYAFKLVFWLNFFDFLRALSQILTLFFKPQRSLCTIIAVIHVFSTFNALSWCLVIAVTIYQVLIQQKPDCEKQYKSWLIGIFTLGLVFSIMPIIFSSYTYDVGVCTFNQQLDGNIFKLGIYGTGLIVTICTTVLYWRIYKKIRKDMWENEGFDEINAKRLLYYPGILILCFLPSLIMRVLEVFGINNFLLYVISGSL